MPARATPITARAEDRSSIREKIDAIKAGVCLRHGLTWDEVISDYRGRRHSAARQDAAYTFRIQAGLTVGRISKELKRTYSTIIYLIGQRERFFVRRTEDIA